MPRWLHLVLQILSVAGGAYVSYKTGSPMAAVISTGVSGAVGVFQQKYNTDGSPQATAYPPPPAVINPIPATPTLPTYQSPPAVAMAAAAAPRDLWPETQAPYPPEIPWKQEGK